MKSLRLEPIEIRPSRQLVAILVSVHAAAIGTLLALPVSSWLIAGSALLLMFSAYSATFHHALLRQSGSIMRLELDDRVRIRMQTRAGHWLSGRILGSSTVAPWLTVLNIRCEDQRRAVHVVLMADSLDPAVFRHLRVWLRWGPLTPSDAVMNS